MPKRHWFTTQACASEPPASIRTARLFSALIEAKSSEAHANMLCRDKTWGAIIFWGWFRYKHTDPSNWLKNPLKHGHTHFPTLSQLENQAIRKQTGISIRVDNGWKGKIHMIWHSFVRNYSSRSIWPLLNGAATYSVKIWRFVYPFTLLLEGIII